MINGRCSDNWFQGYDKNKLCIGVPCISKAHQWNYQLPKINYLHLGSNDLGNEGISILAQASVFSEVTTLNLECNGITAEGAKALAQSPYLTKVEHLNLVDNRVGDEGAMAIANSDNLSNLNYLHLGGNRVKSEEAKSALKNSPKLTKLEKLKIF